MTPQPSALAALQRYDCEYKSGSWDMRRNDNGDYVLFDAVEAAWPTQAQGEAVAWERRRNIPDLAITEWQLISKQEYDWTIAQPDRTIEVRELFTHHSPSIAALREALRDLLSEVDIAIEMKCTIAPNLRKVERARTLLVGTP